MYIFWIQIRYNLSLSHSKRSVFHIFGVIMNSLSFEFTRPVIDPFKEVTESKANSDGPCHFQYVVSDNNEKSKALESLAKQPISGEVLLGVTWFYPLNILAQRRTKAVEHKAKKALTEKKIEWVLLLGIEPNRKLFWKNLNKIVIEIKNHILAKEKIIQLMGKIKEKIFTDIAFEKTPECILKKQIKILWEECENSTSWLSSAEKYSFVRNYFLQNRIKAKTIDLYDPICMKSVATALKTLNLKIDTIYLSNIPEIAANFHKTAELRTSISMLKPYTTDDTLLVDTRAYSIKDFDVSKPTISVLRVRKKMKSAKPEEIIQDYPGFKNFCKKLRWLAKTG